VLAAALATGLGGLALRGQLVIADGAEGLDRHLAEALGEDVLLAMHVGPPRANRKPVLQLLRRDGTIVGFAKVGTNELTRRLVRAETTALSTLAQVPPAGVVVPRVLYHGQWGGLELLVQSPLAVRRARPAPDDRRIAAMRAVAFSTGTEVSTMDKHAYGAVLRQRISALPEPAGGPPAARPPAGEEPAGRPPEGREPAGREPEGREPAGRPPEGLEPAGREPVNPGLVGRLHAVVDKVAEASEKNPLTWGCWHGDWTPWNCAATPGAILVWDWERYATGVPLGFDVLHHHLQSSLAGVPRPGPAQAAGTVQSAPALLASFGLDAVTARLSAKLYLVEIATRYLTDDQAAAGGRLGRVAEWLLPALEADSSQTS
jgi:hypothetical protein